MAGKACFHCISASPGVVLSSSPNAPFLALRKVWLKDEKLGCDMVKDEGKARSGRPFAIDYPLSRTGFLVPWQMMAVVGDHLLPGAVADDGHGGRPLTAS